MKKAFVLLMALMILAACATTPKYEGTFLPKEYASKLEVSPYDPNDLRWIRPGYDFKKYNKAMVDYVVFSLAPDSDYKGIDAEEMKRLADAASKALVDAISAKVPVVSDPGPDVVRVKFAIVDLKQSRPVISAITSVVPVGIGINIIKKGVTDEWTGSGMTKGEMLIQDSMTNEVIAAGYADYSAKFTERFTKWGQVEDAFKYWGEAVVNAWANIKAGKYQYK